MRQVLPLVLFSLILTFGFYSALTHLKKSSPEEKPITTIIQTGPVKEGLKGDALAEILCLSSNHPLSIAPEEAQKILLKIPFIKKAEVALVHPGTLYIDYTLRSPLFILSDLRNMAIDKEGIFFPLSPYFTPKRLPELTLGLDQQPTWETPLCKDKVNLAAHLLTLLGNEVVSIDLSKEKKPSLGQREIVVILDKGGERHLLRLTPRHFKEELKRYKALLPKAPQGDLIIDLRLPHLAYISSTRSRGLIPSETGHSTPSFKSYSSPIALGGYGVALGFEILWHYSLVSEGIHHLNTYY